jgi:hypothetical protein
MLEGNDEQTLNISKNLHVTVFVKQGKVTFKVADKKSVA